MFLFIIICVLNIHMLEKKQKTERKKKQIFNSIPPFEMAVMKKYQKRNGQTCHAQICAREGTDSRRFKWQE